MAPVLTYKNLQDKVLNWLDETGDTSTTLVLVKNALTNAHKKRIAQERWPFMVWGSPELINIVAGQQVYTLHPEYLRPVYFWNRTQLDYVTQYNEATLLQARVDPNNDAGPALKFRLRGRSEVKAQPSSASVIAASSSNIADNGAKTVIIRGDTTDGVRSETITCNSSGAVLFTRILKVTKVGVWAGTMTLTSNATAVTNLKLFPEEAGRSYQEIFFLLIPDQVEVVEYDFYRQPSPLTNDEDRPDIPTPFEELLVYDALLDFATYNSYDASTVGLWRAKQADLLLALQQAYSDAAALEAATNYTSFIPR